MGKIADKSIEVTEEMWLQCNEFNRNMINEFLESSAHLTENQQEFSHPL